jgi:hypothetical protein
VRTLLLVLLLAGCATPKQVLVAWEQGEPGVSWRGEVCVIKSSKEEAYTDFGAKLRKCLEKK